MLSKDIHKITCGKDYLPQSSSPNQELFPLSAQINSEGTLTIGGCAVTTLVKQFGSPLYILDELTLRTACGLYRDSFKKYYPGESLVIYASKAWNSLAVCSIVASEGLGIDVVSGGELYTALRAFEEMSIVDTHKLYFHGNNKSIHELELGINSGCTIVVDNWLELERLSKMAEFPVRIMLRLTPGIECHTHEYIKTGRLDSKFGFDPLQIEKLFSYVSGQANLNCVGLHAHIGSQIFEHQPHEDLGKVLVEWWELSGSFGLNLEQLNVGGGLGISYTEMDDPPSIEQWVKTVAESVVTACEHKGLSLPKIIAEPGRSLIGSACVTAYTVGGIKEVPGIRTYVAVDGGMSDNPRPITYQSLYRAVIANKMSHESIQNVTVAGKHCESGDILIREALLPPVATDDILVVMGTGAYNYSMSSNYNRLTKPAAVLVADGEANVILERETYSDLLRQDRLPSRLLH